MENQKNQRGFTLVELMMVLGISAFLAYSMFAAMRVGDAQMESANLRMTIQDSAREGLYKMVQEIRESAPDRITIGGGCNTISFSIPDPNTPVDDTDYAVNWLAGQVTYSVSGTQILRTLSGSTTVMSNDVSSVLFTTDTASPFACAAGSGLDIDQVTVVMNVQRTMKNGALIPATPLQISGQARIRNS